MLGWLNMERFQTKANGKAWRQNSQSALRLYTENYPGEPDQLTGAVGFWKTAFPELVPAKSIE